MIKLTAEGLRGIFPRAPQDILDAFLAKQAVLDRAGVTHTRPRLAYFFANIEHETDGFTIRGLTENINYTDKRAAQIWPSRFGSAAEVRAKYGTAPGWQSKMFDDVYGNRMGNRPGTHDGSLYIGRGGPQWTGREGYAELERRISLPALEQPQLAARHDLQPEGCAAFWDWKRMNPKADVGDFRGVVRAWNGGYIGIEDRQNRLEGNDKYVARFDDILQQARALPGSPPTVAPPKHVIDATTEKERRARAAGTTTFATGGAGEVAKQGTQQPDKPPPALLSPVVTWTLIGVGVGIFLVAAVLIAKKTAAVKKNWF